MKGSKTNFLFIFRSVIYLILLFGVLVAQTILSFSPLLTVVSLALSLIIIIVQINLLKLLSSRKMSRSDLYIEMVNNRLFYNILEKFYNLLRIDKEKIRQEFVDANNLITTKSGKSKAEDILVLLPHCLQITDCMIRVTSDLANCQICGNCDIGEIKKLVDKYKINTTIVSGGTIARLKIKELKPKLILACACERDLVEGIKDIFPYMVFGIVNSRPEGPCVNTRISVESLSSTIKLFINEA